MVAFLLPGQVGGADCGYSEDEKPLKIALKRLHFSATC